MKLGLVMLTTVISMITERQVEAQLVCYEKLDLTGVQVNITKSTKDVTSQFPNGIRACKVPPKSAWIIYSWENFTGQINTIYSLNAKVHYLGSNFIAKSILKLGKASKPNGVYLFRRKMFQGGLSRNFFKKVTNVKGRSTFRSAVVLGDKSWTIVSKCKKPNNNKNCQTCFLPSNSGASFTIGGADLRDVTAIQPGCSGTKRKGKSSIPECLCNQKGVVDGPNKCDGTNGICQCKANHTGNDCGQCLSTHTLRDGECVEGCGCNPNGVWFNIMDCDPPNSPNGTCFCNARLYGNGYDGEKCDICAPWAWMKNGRCVSCNCLAENTIYDQGPECNMYDGKCKCRPHYAGKCDRCEEGYHKYDIKCLNTAQHNKVKELEAFRDIKSNNKTKLFSILDDLKNLGVVGPLTDRRREISNGWYTAHRGAGLVLANTWAWDV